MKRDVLVVDDDPFIRKLIATTLEDVADFQLHEAAAVIRSHHEHFDGTGYPDGLAGAEIPLVARVFAVADVLDALTTDRPYRPASSFEHARAMIVQGSGTQFDPRVIEAFAAIPDEPFERIARDIQ